MRLEYTEKIRRSLSKFPLEIRERFYKQIEYLVNNIRHPSLRAKKYDDARGIWQARVTDKIRFYFQIESDIYWLLDIEKHPK